MSSPPLVTVVTPVHNEAECLEEFHERTSRALRSISPPVEHEIIYVDDGSSDESPKVLRDICAADRRARVATLSRNFGHQAAITAGLDHAAGDAVVVIDSDLQDPPEVIADLVARWRDGWQVVYAQRVRRDGERWARLVVTKAFYRLLNRMSESPIPPDTGDFRLMDRQVVDVLREALRESNRYLRGLVAWVGFRQCAVTFDRAPRFAGTASYTTKRLIALALDGITSFSVRPLRLASQFGLVVVILALLYAALIVAQRLFWPETAPEGWASVMVVVLFLGGVQLLSIGLLGEYLGRTYRETKGRPLYIIAERRNLPSPTVSRTPQVEREDSRVTGPTSPPTGTQTHERTTEDA